MERSRIQELHYITDMANVASILERGILSNRLARRVAGHESVADAEVQARRASKRVWVGRSSRPLHDYANLYVHARNAMLFILLRSRKGDLTVLAIDPEVLDLDGVVVTDRNAASFASLFLPAAEGIAALDESAVFAEWWTGSSEAKQLRMAEVLVPDRVPASLIKGAYVPDHAAGERLRSHLSGRLLAIRVNRWMFFRSAP
jgi:ssDNA thymidine ADP-ribosyltransferase, DarT